MDTTEDRLEVRVVEEGLDSVKITFHLAGRSLVWWEVVQRWQHDTAFVDLFTDSLATLPFPKFFWETPPLSATTRDSPFEMTILRCTYSFRTPAKDTFSLVRRGEGSGHVVAFKALYSDTILVAPCLNTLQNQPVDYMHLANFSRRVYGTQRHALWKKVGEEVDRMLATHSVNELWVSTEGTGVHWLHVRLARRPMHFHTAAYCPSRFVPDNI